MPFLQHLEELRKVLLHTVVAVLLGAILGWYLSDRMLAWLIENTSGQAMFMKPQGAFMARLKIALVLGALFVLPYIFYRIWSFVGPGLLDTERKVVLPGAVASVFLFYLGVAFSYFLLTPLMVQVLIAFGTGNLTAQIEVNFLLDLVFSMGLACGLVFQLPLAVGFLTVVGIVSPAFLRRYWRHAVVLIFIVAALLTPADPMSQIMLAIPLLILYFVSYFVSLALWRGAKRRREADAHASGD